MQHVRTLVWVVHGPRKKEEGANKKREATFENYRAWSTKLKIATTSFYVQPPHTHARVKTGLPPKMASVFLRVSQLKREPNLIPPPPPLPRNAAAEEQGPSEESVRVLLNMGRVMCNISTRPSWAVGFGLDIISYKLVVVSLHAFNIHFTPFRMVLRGNQKESNHLGPLNGETPFHSGFRATVNHRVWVAS